MVQEWRAAVYASAPGVPGPYCLYYRCLTDPEPELVADLPQPDTDIARQRLMLAASFLREEKPGYIVMFSDARYDDWLAKGPGQDYLFSFVRPLLLADGDCFRTLDVLGKSAIALCSKKAVCDSGSIRVNRDRPTRAARFSLPFNSA